MTVSAPAATAPPPNSPFHHQTVLWVKHWTDRLFSFAVTRPDGFRFRSGEFVMIGLPGETKPVLRAYSIASPNYAEELEFLSIKAPDGPLTSRLQHIQVGDVVLLGKKPTGTLVHDALKPGRHLFLFGTGTGLAPWLSVARDYETYDKFEKVIVAHGVREVAELCYRDLFTREIFEDELIGEMAKNQLVYYPTVTREPFERQGRLTTLIETGQIFADLGLEQTRFDPELDRVMICGSMDMTKSMAQVCADQGMDEGSIAKPGDFVFEKAFVG